LNVLFSHLWAMAFLPQAQLEKMGFRSLGKHVLVSEKASIYNPSHISLGNHVRIDDFAVLSAGAKGIRIGSHVHIACFCGIFGRDEVVLDDFAGLSSRVVLYSSTDDYSGDWLTNPTVDEVFRNVHSGPVRLGKHVIVGTASTILPGVHLDTGCAVSAHSMVTKSFEPMKLVGGIPARVIKTRSDVMLILEKKALAAGGGG
jgi:acetyltransferase-like isoleucine patch superfamily enzyme